MNADSAIRNDLKIEITDEKLNGNFLPSRFSLYLNDTKFEFVQKIIPIKNAHGPFILNDENKIKNVKLETEVN